MPNLLYYYYSEQVGLGMKKNLKPLIFVIFFILQSLAYANTLSQKSKNSVFLVDTKLTFFINGDFSESTVTEFKQLLQQYPNHIGADVYLHSPGGSLISGIELGTIFRQLKMRSLVGYHQSGKILPGLCASACAVAYFGGYERFLNLQSNLGLHQFYYTTADSSKLKAKDAVVRSQELSAILVEYWDLMEIDLKLFSIMSSTPGNTMHWVSAQDRINYNINTFPKVPNNIRAPYLNETGIKGFREFTSFPAKYKAFAIAEDGAWGWKAMDSREAIDHALKICETNNKSNRPCKLYAINDTVVWK
jgi:hypothetical protein